MQRVAWCWVAVAVAAGAVEPLSEAGADAEAVRGALAAMARGDMGPFAQLPAQVWEQPPAVADPHDPALARRWTWLIPEAVARGGGRVPPRAAPQHARDAWDWPDDPRSARLLRQAGQEFWDRGQPDAAAVLGWVPVEVPVALGGAGVRCQAVPPAPMCAVVVQRGWVMGLDPWQRVWWQRRVDDAARGVGGDAAVVVSHAGNGLITATGMWQPLPPMPAGTMPVAATAAGAWFSHAETSAWWWLPAPGTAIAGATGAQPLRVPERIVGPPLVRGRLAWWLTEDDVVEVDGAQIRRRQRHGVVLGAAAHLMGRLDDPWLADGSGGLWRLEGPPVAPPVVALPPLPRAPVVQGPPHERQALPVYGADGTWQVAGDRLRLWEAAGRTWLSSSGSRTWTTSWMSPPGLAAPGRAWAVVGEQVVVLEGLRWVTVVDVRGGQRRVTVEAPGADPGDVAVDGRGWVAWLRGGHVRLRRAGEPEEAQDVPAEPGCLVGLAEGFGWLSPAGTWWVRPGQPLQVVAARAWVQPRIAPGGVQDGVQWWPWTSATLTPGVPALPLTATPAPPTFNRDSPLVPSP